jgi:PAS domain S-box-containing protein
MEDELQWYKDFYELAPIGFYTTSIEDGSFLRANPYCVKMLGYESFEELANSIKSTQLYAKRKRNEIIKKLQSNDQVTEELRLKFSDGRQRWVLVTARMCKSNACIEGSIVDVTDRKALEDQIEAYRKEESEKLERMRISMKQRITMMEGK